jgi:predicted GNAT family N-acyltransferase
MYCCFIYIYLLLIRTNVRMEIKIVTSEDTLSIRHQVMWPEKGADFVRVEGDSQAVHFGLFDDGLLISVISLFYGNHEVQFRKFATLAVYQGRGYGTALLRFVLDDIAQGDIGRVWCNARKAKVEFYKRQGMVATAKSFDKNGIEYVEMEMMLEHHPKG